MNKNTIFYGNLSIHKKINLTTYNEVIFFFDEINNLGKKYTSFINGHVAFYLL